MNTDEPLPDPNTPPPAIARSPTPAPRRRRVTWAIAIGVAVAGLVVAGSAVAFASGDDDEAGADHPGHPGIASGGEPEETPTDGSSPTHPGRGRHHEPLPPYEERYAAATDEARAAADGLLADVRATLAAYEDPEAAVAAGYQAPRSPRGPMWHYLNPTLRRAGAVLDPDQPTGLVYYTPKGGEPVLVGAFFVAGPGATAPTPAGELVVWHSHSPRCPGFFATNDEPCTDTARILHVWAAAQVELLNPRTEQIMTLRVTDPFGAPFRASVEPA